MKARAYIWMDNAFTVDVDVPDELLTGWRRGERLSDGARNTIQRLLLERFFGMFRTLSPPDDLGDLEGVGGYEDFDLR